MKNTTRSITLLVSTLAASSISASAAVVVAGWDTWNSATAPGASVVAPGVTGTAVTTTESNSWNTNDGRGSSSDGVWGNAATVTPGASTLDVDGENLTLPNAATGGTITFSISNNGTADINLEGFHLDAYAFRPHAARTYAVSIVGGGGITAGNIFTSIEDEITHVGGAWANDAHDDIDLSLSGLADHTLGAGEAVDILLAFSDGTGNGAGGHHLFVDNVAVSGTVVPEPSSAAFLGLSGFALLLRRRRK